MRTAPITAALILLGAVLCSAPAFSQSDPSPQEVERAERLYLEAVQAFQAGDHVRAAELFRTSYDLLPKPELIYNEAVAWGSAGQLRKARAAAVRASSAGLPDGMSVKNRARLHAWNTRLAAQKKSTTIAQVASRQPRPDESPDAEPAPEAPATDETLGSAGGRIAGISLGAAGLGAFLAAGILELQLSKTTDQLDSAAGADDEDAYAAALRDGRKMQTAGRLLVVSGAALVGTGAIVWAFSRERPAPTDTTASISFGPGSARFTLEF